MFFLSTKPRTVLRVGKELVNALRVLSTEMRQVFRAYTKQLKSPPKDEEQNAESLHMRKGFEQVDLSKEAIELSASENSEIDKTPEEKV